ncbi:Small nuclear ribonucleoprotein E [Orchesella cincta]|uniref:Small nuclear ribonucleoprotein E n=1 Tax=Orchesella cincta TaxID=48709 RepID=A0A1D2N4E3_ORCCI|nr:Small nuclear ribonucleoprotein E [Orchesella cincta]
MAYKQSSHKVQKVMIQPINLIFRHLQNRTKVSVWLYDRDDLRVEGIVVGFDEFMNLVLDKAEEVSKRKTETKRKPVGRIMLKGDNVAVIQPVDAGGSIAA